MDKTTTEVMISVVETEKIGEVQNNEASIESPQPQEQQQQQQQRQDFTSDAFKIEITNLGKFAFGVCYYSKFHL